MSMFDLSHNIVLSVSSGINVVVVLSNDFEWHMAVAIHKLETKYTHFTVCLCLDLSQNTISSVSSGINVLVALSNDFEWHFTMSFTVQKPSIHILFVCNWHFPTFC